ncbi:hypothetical protein M2145_000997 [Lachnospiraceae bacterium PF1-21]|uniref:S1 family peptidase n=1 Tax=Ohessyouella blattaphilus TaxID=2949333 RepID=UPI003E27F0D6
MIIERDKAFRLVCNIRTPVGEGNVITGTGMFVSSNNEEFLVTAGHVVEKSNLNTFIVLADDYSNPIRVKLSELVGNNKWQYHKEADLAVIKLVSTENNITLLANRCLPIDHINLEKDCVSRDFELTSIGFPHGLGLEGKFSPLTYRSYASSSFLTLLRADKKGLSVFFCLENPSVGGYSGCPVFDLGYLYNGVMRVQRGETKCHGFTHGTMSDDTGGKIALITPAYYLRDLV